MFILSKSCRYAGGSRQGSVSLVGIVTGIQGSVVGIVTGVQGSVMGIMTRCGLDGPRIECGRARFSMPSRLAPRPIQPPLQQVPGLPRGQSGHSVLLTTYNLQAPSCKCVGAISVPPRACPGMSWGDFY
jgi:hypothetical protein